MSRRTDPGAAMTDRLHDAALARARRLASLGAPTEPIQLTCGELLALLDEVAEHRAGRCPRWCCVSCGEGRTRCRQDRAAPSLGAAWPDDEAIRAAIRAERERQRYSRQQLSARLAEVGHPMDANTLWKIETGKRRITVEDVRALNAALDVNLLAPADGGEFQ